LRTVPVVPPFFFFFFSWFDLLKIFADDPFFAVTSSPFVKSFSCPLEITFLGVQYFWPAGVSLGFSVFACRPRHQFAAHVAFGIFFDGPMLSKTRQYLAFRWDRFLNPGFSVSCSRFFFYFWLLSCRWIFPLFFGPPQFSNGWAPLLSPLLFPPTSTYAALPLNTISIFHEAQ